MDTPDWGRSFSIEYWWQETHPEPRLNGSGVIHYDAGRGAYALRNRFFGQDRELGYILLEEEGLAWVFERRGDQRICHRHATDRRVRLHEHLTAGRDEGPALVLGRETRMIAYEEPGEHDRWLWLVDEAGDPLRFFTWTHHGRIQVLHDVRAVERGKVLDDDLFRPPADFGCAEPVPSAV